MGSKMEEEPEAETAERTEAGAAEAAAVTGEDRMAVMTI